MPGYPPSALSQLFRKSRIKLRILRQGLQIGVAGHPNLWSHGKQGKALCLDAYLCEFPHSVM